MRKLLDFIREEFEKECAEKTSFGRNKLKEMHERALANATMRYLDYLETR